MEISHQNAFSWGNLLCHCRFHQLYKALISVNHISRGCDRVTSTTTLHCPGNVTSSDNISKRFQVLIRLEGIPAAPIISFSDLFIDVLQPYCFILIIKKNQGTSFCQEPAWFQLKLSKNKLMTCQSVDIDFRTSSGAAFYEGQLDEHNTTAKRTNI